MNVRDEAEGGEGSSMALHTNVSSNGALMMKIV